MFRETCAKIRIVVVWVVPAASWNILCIRSHSLWVGGNMLCNMPCNMLCNMLRNMPCNMLCNMLCNMPCNMLYNMLRNMPCNMLCNMLYNMHVVHLSSFKIRQCFESKLCGFLWVLRNLHWKGHLSHTPRNVLNEMSPESTSQTFIIPYTFFGPWLNMEGMQQY